MTDLRDQFPLRLIIGRDDCTFLLSDGATFSNVDSSDGTVGGFEAASFSIPKDMPETLRGMYVRLDSGLGVAWEGRVSEVQRSLGNKTAIQCEGYAALFKDQTGSMVFVDRDLTRWQDPSYPRQLQLANGNHQLGSSQVASDPDSNNPALVQSITDSWDAPNNPDNESWYDAGPLNLIASIYYALTSSGEDATGNWVNEVAVASDSVGTSSLNTGNLFDGPATAYFTPGSQYRFAALQQSYALTPAGIQGAIYNSYWQNVAVYGNHGLPGRGPDPVGLYPSDIAGWAAGQIGGLQDGVIVETDASNFIVPHSVYYTPVTLDQIVGDMATIGGWHAGVWQSLAPLTGNATPRFDFRPRPQPGAFTAFCHRRDCDTLDIREDLSGQYSLAIVAFTNVDGTDGVAAWQVDNPILDQAGIPERVLVLQGGTMTVATAALFAAEAIALTNAQSVVAGSADVIAAIGGPAGPKAPWMLQAGIDRLRIGDLPSTDAFGAFNDLPISRVECSVSSSGMTTSVELGAGADLVETLQARLSAASTLAAQGGV